MDMVSRFPGYVASYIPASLSNTINSLYEQTPSWKRIQELSPIPFAILKDGASLIGAYHCCKRFPNWFLGACIVGIFADDQAPSAIDRIINIWKTFPGSTSLAAFYFLPMSFKASTVLLGSYMGAKISKHVKETHSPKGPMQSSSPRSPSSRKPAPCEEPQGILAHYLQLRGFVAGYLIDIPFIKTIYEKFPGWEDLRQLAPSFFSYTTSATYATGAYLCGKEWPYLFWSSCIIGAMAPHKTAKRTTTKIKNVWNTYKLEITLAAIQFSHIPKITLAPLTFVPFGRYRFGLMVPTLELSLRTALVATLLFGLRVGSKVSKIAYEKTHPPTPGEKPQPLLIKA